MKQPSTDSVSIGIAGVGQMGVSAAACFSRAGLDVTVWARNADRLAEVPAKLTRMQDFLDEHEATSVPRGPVRLATELLELRHSGLILECIAEDLDQKATLLRALAPAAEQGAVLASCTSGLSITEMGRRSGLGRRCVGAHFWNPPHLMPVVEVVRGEETEPGLVEFTAELLRRAGKIPVVCKDVPGFIGNRLMHAMWREALHLVQNGVCSADDLDRVARLTFGLRLPAVGPLENMDLVGLPLLAQIQSYLLADLSQATETMPIVAQQLTRGQAGMRTGVGFYDWRQRDADTLIEQRDRQIVRQLQFLREVGRLS